MHFSAILPSMLVLSAVLSTQSNAFVHTPTNPPLYNPFYQLNSVQTPVVSSQATPATKNSSIPANRLIPPANFPYGRPTLGCVIEAAQRRSIPVDVFLAVQSVERGETGQQIRNSNATYDLGAFQINTIHLPRIAQLGGSKDDVLKRGCFNAEVASLLLHEAITHPKKQHEDFFTRASGYHSWTPRYNQIYRNKLIRYTKQWQNWLRANNMANLATTRIG